jgi:hypothetical protein
VNDSVLVLYAALHANEPFVKYDHRIEAVDIGHHYNVGMTGFIFKRNKDQAVGRPGMLAGDDGAWSRTYFQTASCCQLEHKGTASDVPNPRVGDGKK